MRPRLHGRAGFTLLELLLVMTIIAILAGIVVVGFGNIGEGRRVRAEAERLALAIEMGRSEALRRNAMWGLSVSDNSYDFKEYDHSNGQWQSVERRPFSIHTVAEDITLAMQVRTDGVPFGDLANLALAQRQGEEQDQRWQVERWQVERWQGEREEGERQEEDDDAPSVDIVILPGGELTPFDIAVAGTDTAPWAVRSDGIQTVRALLASDVPAMDAELARLGRWL